MRAASVISRFLQRLAGLFPLTPAGILLAIGAGALFRYGALEHQDLLLAMAIPVLGTLLSAAVMLTVLAAALLRFAIRGQKTTADLCFEVGEPCATGVRFRFPRAMPLVELSAAWDIPGEVILRRAGGFLMEWIVPARRGVFCAVRRSFVLRDALGLARIRFSVTEPVELRVLPARRRLDPLSIPPALAAGDEFADPAGAARGDLTDMRAYTPGDSPRLVLWKIYGRTRRLMVRRPEPALQEIRKMSVWFVPGCDDEEAAAAARAAVEQQLLGSDWLLAAEGVPGDAEEIPAALDLLARSGTARGHRPASLSAFREFGECARLRGAAGCIAIGPESRRQDLEMLAQDGQMPTQVLVAGPPPARKRAWWRRLVFVAAAEPRKLYAR